MSPEEVLRKYWGFDSFRNNQRSIIQSALDQNDTLALMATGGGKSICYQVPALMKSGVTIVISPLIALMKDQVVNLKERGISAEAIFSGMHPTQVDRILDNAIYGEIKLLYLSPERLKSDMAIARIQKMNVNLIAVDEAHCVSQWGYDFRPAYLEIGEIRKLHPKTPILALTATATSKVIDDIKKELQLSRPNVFESSFARPNISFKAIKVEAKEYVLEKIITKEKLSTIIYVRTRKQAKIFSNHLSQLGINADFYHAGLSSKERLSKQAEWTKDKINVMVCTNAFGMGIDKANVRKVIHLHIPDNIESYYQEAGRAGRDGDSAEAIILYYESDIENLHLRIQQNFPPIALLRKVYQSIGNYYNLAVGSGQHECYEFEISKFCKAYNYKILDVHNVITVLEKEGWFALSDGYRNSSSLRFKISGNQAIDYQEQNIKSSEIISALLRNYQYVGSEFTPIDENTLASQIGIEESEVIQKLNQLNKEDIIEYSQRTNKPQLTFLNERVSAKNLTIDHQSFQIRKKRKLQSADAMIGYINYANCRQQYILRYFGESSNKPCGICDRCKSKIGSVNSTGLIIDYISKHFCSGPFNKKDLLTLDFSHQNINAALSHLLDEGKLEIHGNSYLWKRKR